MHEDIPNPMLANVSLCFDFRVVGEFNYIHNLKRIMVKDVYVWVQTYVGY